MDGTTVVITGYGHGRAIFERDGWRCANPVCRSRRDLHLHHVEFRSQGGSNAASNLVVLCDRCHRRLHAGHITIEGLAPHGLVFLIGRRPREAWHGLLRAAA